MSQTAPTEAPPSETLQEGQTVEDRSTEFVPVEGGQQGTASAEALLIAAYVLMWLAIFVFVWLTARRQKTLGHRLQEIEGALSRHDDAEAEGVAKAATGASASEANSAQSG